MSPVVASQKTLGDAHVHSDIKHQFHRSVETGLGSRTPRTPTTVFDAMGHIRVDARVTRKNNPEACHADVLCGRFSSVNERSTHAYSVGLVVFVGPKSTPHLLRGRRLAQMTLVQWKRPRVLRQLVYRQSTPTSGSRVFKDSRPASALRGR